MKKPIKLIGFFAVCIMTFCVSESTMAEEHIEKAKAVQSLISNFPNIQTYREEGVINRLYGQSIGYGDNPVKTAEQFKNSYSMVFGVNADDLMPKSNLHDERHALPLMYDLLTGEYKFTLIYYSQHYKGIQVFRSDLRLLVRNQHDYPLVLAASSLKDLSKIEINMNNQIDNNLIIQSVSNFSPKLRIISEPVKRVWAGMNIRAKTPRLAIKVVADNQIQSTQDYEKWMFLIDPISGDILYKENMILNIDITGNVSGNATSGNGADICGPEPTTPMPYSRVYSGSTVTYADSSGNYNLSWGGVDPVTVSSNIWGQWFRVFNTIGSDAQIDMVITPPGPANFIHNSTNTSEYNRAEVNAYVQANVVRDFVIKYFPDYPLLQQTGFPVNVNIGDNCNAYYDYSSINFFTSGGGCANSAFSTVIHHEYGHHLVYAGGSGQGQYGEGMGDVLGILITDDPNLAYGFYNNCNDFMRTGDNTFQYPCSGEIHYCGQLISGCVWSTRNELQITYPNEYRDIVSSLAINSIPLHSGTEITPSITIDFLTLDDDDSNIGNGTPHYPEICAGFNAHNMECPELNLISFYYPDGRPELTNPAGGTEITVEVQPVAGNPELNTGVFYYNIGTGFVSQPMDMISPHVYSAFFPGVECGATISYYISIETTLGVEIVDPPGAPNNAFSAMSANSQVEMFLDDFNTNQGWSVINSTGLTDGAWQRAIPAGGGDRGDPPTDYDGSGYCFVTDNADDNSDVDGGYTYLISPTFDFEDLDGIVNYALWYTNNTGDDPNNDLFKVYISNNNGSTWIVVETIGPVTSPGWTLRSFVTGQFVEPTNQMKLRFEASDLGSGSIVEAGIDAVSIFVPDCELSGCNYIPGDINGNLQFNGLDVTFSVAYLKGGPEPSLICDCPTHGVWFVSGDVNASCSFNGLDVTYAVSYFKGGLSPVPCPDCPPIE